MLWFPLVGLWLISDLLWQFWIMLASTDRELYAHCGKKTHLQACGTAEVEESSAFCFPTLKFFKNQIIQFFVSFLSFILSIIFLSLLSFILPPSLSLALSLYSFFSPSVFLSHTLSLYTSPLFSPLSLSSFFSTPSLSLPCSFSLFFSLSPSVFLSLTLSFILPLSHSFSLFLSASLSRPLTVYHYHSVSLFLPLVVGLFVYLILCLCLSISFCVQIHFLCSNKHFLLIGSIDLETIHSITKEHEKSARTKQTKWNKKQMKGK